MVVVVQMVGAQSVGVAVGTVPPAQAHGAQVAISVGAVAALAVPQVVQVVAPQVAAAVVAVVQVAVEVGVLQRTVEGVHTPATTHTHATRYVSTRLLAT